MNLIRRSRICYVFVIVRSKESPFIFASAKCEYSHFLISYHHFIVVYLDINIITNIAINSPHCSFVSYCNENVFISWY